MTIKVYITKMERYGQSGWQWNQVVILRNEIESDKHKARTNEDGKGLWYDERQRLGTGEFYLLSDKKAARRKIIRRLQITQN